MRNFGKLTFSILFALTALIPVSVQAQTFTVLYSFTGGQDGGNPNAGLTLAGTRNLYGTAAQGGGKGAGTVFQVTHKGSGWLFSSIYSFGGGLSGDTPLARAISGPNGTLYVTTSRGGYYNGGTVFNLAPPVSACKSALCAWTGTEIYRDFYDGNAPHGDLLFDQVGNLYGTTSNGGSYGLGNVYELTPSIPLWSYNTLYSFMGGSDGEVPAAGVIFDQAGNLYGTTTIGGIVGCNGGYGCGTVYKLTPSGSGWTKNTLHSFQGGSDGAVPVGGLIFDESGNLYGTTSIGGAGDGGTVYRLTPSSGQWTFTVLYSFTGSGGPDAGLTMDAEGNLYGTTSEDGVYGYGNVFKLSPLNGGWTYTSLYDFTGGNDGKYPYSNAAFGANGNLYGTTNSGGTGSGCASGGCGVVWEITP